MTRQLMLLAAALLLAIAPATAMADGKALVVKFECNRCHDIEGVQPAPRQKHCVDCHQAIEAGTFDADKATLAEWSENIVSLRQVPSLEHVGQRLKRSWIASYLQHPYDLRPDLPATMPRLAMTKAEADAIAQWLAPHGEGGTLPESTPAEVQRGMSLLADRGCLSCHTFTGAHIPTPNAAPVALSDPLAPDLAYTRLRFRPDRLTAWIQNPKDLFPDARMPALAVSEPDARAMAAAIVYTPLAEPPKARVPERRPILKRRVTYAEVEERVFKKVCWHCHSDPDFALGDGGPGNTGGFGFDPVGLNLASYESILSGSIDATGKRRSVFRKTRDGTPLLLAVLLARQREEAHRPSDELRGMPLGLPAMSPEDIQLVESWIAQGRPR